ncbi:WavE lipopolysaccharide synthesis family protein [Tianweitania populi]|uniref:WavE lipopolysaccharide synthesis n=1 Tax=Tianweitania populi TaxID=1607949 RepID=A0A8J3GM30_9HYPH|nr:WavE lipopolysaccharide synthesis family protein [Tianweitania populi]GHD21435.1 hypothetical protein GCM10016234_35080 [Tianweitania populi]
MVSTALFGHSVTFEDKDITFVVQGPVSRTDGAKTSDTIASIRHFFPKSHLILSTWEDEDTDAIAADEVIKSADPGPIVSDYEGLQISNNVNRQITSTRAGMEKAQTPFAVKLRSDARVTGRGFVSLDQHFPARLPQDRVFERRIVISKQITRSSRSFVPMAYHPGDLFQFGLTSDLRFFWKADLLDGQALCDFILARTPDVRFKMFDRFRYTTEQYLFLSALNRAGHNPKLRDYAEINDQIVADSEQMLFNNFIPCEPEILGIFHQRFSYRAQQSLVEDCLGLREFLAWYLGAPTQLGAGALVGTTAPRMSLMLRAERVGREVLKHNRLMRSLYAGRFLKR